MNLYSVLVFLTAACILVSAVNLIVSRQAVTLGLLTRFQYRKRVVIIVVALFTLFMGLWTLRTW
ncbi:hypothetical protein BI311_23760 (plasmid) [Xanthomonas citri pv. citri]|nr:hypothetical protein BI311_23760 [Xanthomonas citri pv. citri]